MPYPDTEIPDDPATWQPRARCADCGGRTGSCGCNSFPGWDNIDIVNHTCRACWSDPDHIHT